MQFDESQPEPIVSPDTDNATQFHPDEAPPELREQFERFERYNSGLYNGDWVDKAKIRRIHNLAIFDAISGQLELTEYQKRRGRQIFDRINLRRFGHPVELVAFCVCMWVAREDGRLYHPKRSSENNDTLFAELADDLDFRLGLVESCFNRITEVIETRLRS